MNRELSRNHLKDLLITLQHWHAWEAQATECQLQIWQRTPSGILYSIVNAVPQLPGGRNQLVARPQRPNMAAGSHAMSQVPAIDGSLGDHKGNGLPAKHGVPLQFLTL